MAYKLISTEFPDQNQTFIDSLESALWAVQKIQGSPETINDLIKEIEKAKALLPSD
jgi:formylmethanofuran dehydrogenase subunit E-like metal-binding protein